MDHRGTPISKWLKATVLKTVYQVSLSTHTRTLHVYVRACAVVCACVRACVRECVSACARARARVLRVCVCVPCTVTCMAAYIEKRGRQNRLPMSDTTMTASRRSLMSVCVSRAFQKKNGVAQDRASSCVAMANPLLTIARLIAVLNMVLWLLCRHD